MCHLYLGYSTLTVRTHPLNSSVTHFLIHPTLKSPFTQSVIQSVYLSANDIFTSNFTLEGGEVAVVVDGSAFRTLNPPEHLLWREEEEGDIYWCQPCLFLAAHFAAGSYMGNTNMDFMGSSVLCCYFHVQTGDGEFVDGNEKEKGKKDEYIRQKREIEYYYTTNVRFICFGLSEATLNKERIAITE